MKLVEIWKHDYQVANVYQHFIHKKQNQPIYSSFADLETVSVIKKRMHSL